MRLDLGNDRPNDTEQMHSNCPYFVVGEPMVLAALPSSYHAGYINPNVEVTQCGLKSTWALGNRNESATFVTNIVTNKLISYNVTCNEVKVLKNGLHFTSLKVKVFPFLNTSLKVKVLKLLLMYSNALLLLRYCTTLKATTRNV